MTHPKPPHPRKDRPKKPLQDQIREGVYLGLHDFFNDLLYHIKHTLPTFINAKPQQEPTSRPYDPEEVERWIAKWKAIAEKLKAEKRAREGEQEGSPAPEKP